VERARDRRPPPRAAGPREQREPVIVRVVRVQHVHPVLARDGAQPPGVVRDLEGRQPRAEMEAVDQRDSGLTRLGLEPVAGRHRQQHVMAARVLGARELDRGVGAARPPAVGREVQDAQRSRAHWICRRSGFAGLRRSTVGESTRPLIRCRRSGFAGRSTQARLAFGCGSHHGSTVGESTRTLIGFAVGAASQGSAARRSASQRARS
jgi:hypothetical protein